MTGLYNVLTRLTVSIGNTDVTGHDVFCVRKEAI